MLKPSALLALFSSVVLSSAAINAGYGAACVIDDFTLPGVSSSMRAAVEDLTIYPGLDVILVIDSPGWEPETAKVVQTRLGYDLSSSASPNTFVEASYDAEQRQLAFAMAMDSSARPLSQPCGWAALRYALGGDIENPLMGGLNLNEMFDSGFILQIQLEDIALDQIDSRLVRVSFRSSDLDVNPPLIVTREITENKSYLISFNKSEFVPPAAYGGSRTAEDTLSMAAILTIELLGKWAPDKVCQELFRGFAWCRSPLCRRV